MPLLANSCKKNSSRSRGDNGVERNRCCDQKKSENDNAVSRIKKYSDEPKSKFKYDGVGIVKTFLGPSLEDAVIKTIEFGKSLMQKNNENELAYQEKFLQRQIKKTSKGKTKNHTQKCLEYGLKSRGCGGKKHTDYRKLSNLSKIRSLDSDLKTVPHSPEKIKKQLEALIQINKGESERLPDWNLLKKMTTVPVEMTVMPSVCVYNKDAELNSSSYDAQSLEKSSGDQSSSVRERRPRTRLGAPTGIYQAPEFLSNALGPTIDVSIMDNLKMMRDIFKIGESGRGEEAAVGTEGSKRSSGVSFANSGTSKPVSGRRQSSTPPPYSKASSKSRESVSGRVKEEEKKIQELLEKQFALQKQIEMEEQERASRKAAFEEEQRKMLEMKARLPCMDKQVNTKVSSTQKPQMNYDSKCESLKQRIAFQEEKLSRLKDQYECYRRELYTARSRCEAIQRNKCILDAWDVIASRACHTRLPSFTRAYALERKELKANESSENMHCCFLSPEPITQENAVTPSSCPKKCKSQNQCGNFPDMFPSKSEESVSFEQKKTGLMAGGEIPFPIQRDITCGLHQALRTCSCKSMGKGDAVTCTSDDELLKKCGDGEQENKPACRSMSDTATRTETCSKIVKVLWAVTRINIFQDNCRTYEVMDATTTPPQKMPVKTEGIFVVRSSQKRRCQESIMRKKCTINFCKK